MAWVSGLGKNDRLNLYKAEGVVLKKNVQRKQENLVQAGDEVDR